VSAPEAIVSFKAKEHSKANSISSARTSWFMAISVMLCLAAQANRKSFIQLKRSSASKLLQAQNRRNVQLSATGSLCKQPTSPPRTTHLLT
jgi:hypothetical protein